jgi:cell division septum initiation protein DivIVA
MAYEADLPSPDGGFAVVRRGYDQGQVDTHLRRLDAEIQILVTDRDAAIDQSAQLGQELDDARLRTERLRVQIRNLVSPPQSIQGMSERMRSMLRLAEDEAGEMLKRAGLEATQTQLDAEAQAAEVIATARDQATAFHESAQARAESSARDLARARAEFEEEVRATRERFAADQAAADRQRSTSWAESETRRKLVEEDFTLAMNRRRTDALAALTVEQEQLEHDVQQMRDAATAHALSEMEQARANARAELERARESALALTAEGQRRARELLLLRNRIVEQLGGTHSALGEALGRLGGALGRARGRW